MINIENIHVVFGKETPLENSVLRGLNLNIKQGEWINLVGGNGAGKSTLMDVIAGEILPLTGKIIINGIDVTKFPANKRAMLVSRVFQDPLTGTCKGLSIEENMALAYARGKQRRLTSALSTKFRRKIRERIAELNLGLEHRLSDHIDVLSGGQRQALSLLMATFQPSNLLLLDEHTAALDPNMREKVIEITKKIIEKHRLTVLMITHNMQQALHLGTRTIVINNGRITNDYAGETRNQLSTLDLLAKLG